VKEIVATSCPACAKQRNDASSFFCHQIFLPFSSRSSVVVDDGQKAKNLTAKTYTARGRRWGVLH